MMRPVDQQAVHPPLWVVAERVRHALVLRVAGELDMLTSPLLQDALDRHRDAVCDPVVLDLTEVTFLGSSGLRLLLAADEGLAAQGRRLRVVGSSHAVLRPILATGLESVLLVTDTLAAALAR